MRFSEGKYEDSTAILSIGCIKWNIDDVASIVYMIHDRDLNSNEDMDDILFLLAE